jgi:hypothetical protein
MEHPPIQSQKKVFIGRAPPSAVVTERTLILPDVNANSSETVSINGVGITVMFSDIFTLQGVVVIPYFWDGLLFGLMREKNIPPEGTAPIEYPPYTDSIVEIPSYLDGIGKFILYHYNNTNHRLESDFETIGSKCTAGNTLIIPTFGARNGVSFFNVASRIFYSLVSCLTMDTSELRKLSAIIIATPFDQSQDSSSTRVIKHLFNLITIYEKTVNEPQCIICRDMKRNVILSCGHRIACARCMLDIGQHHSRCPLCNAPITSIYPCYTVADMTDTPCGEGHTKAQKIFVPCGHYNVCCLACESQHLSAQKCPICNEEIVASIKLYQ